MKPDKAKARFCDYIANLQPDNPFVLVDVGCSGGLLTEARLVGARLEAIGFDPNRSEIERLRSLELNPNVRFECAFVGSIEASAAGVTPRKGILCRNPWSRLAVSKTMTIRESKLANKSDRDRTQENLWQQVELADPIETIVLPDYARAHGIRSIDFIKIDVDGNDFVILESLAPLLDLWEVLALHIEVNFFGAGSTDENSLHNVDRLLKIAGFELVGLTTRRYATGALPSRYVSQFPGPSKVGRILQGDALYVRDVCASAASGAVLPLGKLLNLVTILTLWDLPDMAAEVIDRWPQNFGNEESIIVGKELLLQVLKGLDGSSKSVGYVEHMRRFSQDHLSFYSGATISFIRRLPGAHRALQFLPVRLVRRLKQLIG